MNLDMLLETLFFEEILENKLKEIGIKVPQNPRQKEKLLGILDMMSKNIALEKSGIKQGAQEALEKARGGDWQEAINLLQFYTSQTMKKKRKTN